MVQGVYGFIQTCVNTGEGRFILDMHWKTNDQSGDRDVPYYVVDGSYTAIIGIIFGIENSETVEVHNLSEMCFAVDSIDNLNGANNLDVTITSFSVVDPEVSCSDSNGCTSDYCSLDTGFCVSDTLTGCSGSP
jgi:hypothetical protein